MGQAVSDVEQANLRKAVILLSSMDGEAARDLLKQLPDDQRRRVRDALRTLERVSPDEQQLVLSEFQRLAGDPGSDDSVEWDVSDQTLVESRSDENEDFDTPLSSPPTVGGTIPNEFPVDVLRDALAEERPQAVAATLRQVPSDLSHEVLQQFAPERRVEIQRRLARDFELHPQVASVLRDAVCDRVRDSEQHEVSKTSGTATDAVANLDKEAVELPVLGTPERAVTREPVTELPHVSPQSIPDACHIEFSRTELDVLLEVQPDVLSTLLKELPAAVWAVALSGSGRELTGQLLALTSAGRMEQIRRSLSHLGPVRLRDIDRAQRHILQAVVEAELRSCQEPLCD